jgi:conjugative transfer signal peptidase TraF
LAAPFWRAGGQASNSCPRSWRARVRLRPLLFALATAALVTAGAGLAASRLTRNYTPSLPLGVYLLRPGLLVTKGALVDFEIPAGARALIVGRYLPARFHLLKRVVALEGDLVCFADGSYRVDGTAISTIARRDAIGRPLRVFEFCGRVPAGMAFVATPCPSSLDSRYFGPLPLSDLTVATPLWTS